jgi:hypothetical protein
MGLGRLAARLGVKSNEGVGAMRHVWGARLREGAMAEDYVTAGGGIFERGRGGLGCKACAVWVVGYIPARREVLMVSMAAGQAHRGAKR